MFKGITKVLNISHYIKTAEVLKSNIFGFIYNFNEISAYL